MEELCLYITVVAAAGLLSFFLCCYSYFKTKDEALFEAKRNGRNRVHFAMNSSL
ncbi:hypothetical protein [Priestia filamentosa]|uniref:hypothetical protein n=1 Tax=Priestia filamentosa TaxID=1402861 RepID=UPI000A083743|nr:hypothetical protein [Priestia filamentosa]MDT3761739.1 hypothetical protein [Priestia filamentosa]WCM16835.1 hypothetical protein PGN40_05665 [Priestia filamentosa]WRU96247.1 hypothetical protein RYX51_03975 [Priestia filamentosa]SMF44665.1 hypothetical protein SAMN06296056_103259 [Priestia filamentosa]